MMNGYTSAIGAFKKEARILNKLSHPNIVRFYAYNPDDLSFLLAYHEFKFVDPIPIRNTSLKPINNLDQLMQKLDKVEVSIWEHILPIVAYQIVEGLLYLHSQGVSHRDLKPQNVLVSNQHYSDLSNSVKGEFWERDPIQIKLTDFGECWANRYDEERSLKTRTTSVFRGTPVYMAPEILNTEMRPTSMKKEQVEQTDIWSMCIIFYSIMNPDRPVPFRNEDDGGTAVQDLQQVLKDKFSNHILPSDSPKYSIAQSTTWLNIYDAYLAGAIVESKKRQNLLELRKILRRTEKIEPKPL